MNGSATPRRDCDTTAPLGARTRRGRAAQHGRSSVFFLCYVLRPGNRWDDGPASASTGHRRVVPIALRLRRGPSSRKPGPVQEHLVKPGAQTGHRWQATRLRAPACSRVAVGEEPFVRSSVRCCAGGFTDNTLQKNVALRAGMVTPALSLRTTEQTHGTAPWGAARPTEKSAVGVQHLGGATASAVGQVKERPGNLLPNGDRKISKIPTSLPTPYGNF